MSENLVKLINDLDSYANGEGPDEFDIQVNLLQEFIPVDAPDAKQWYGAGGNVLESIDETIKFVDRIASPAVKAHIGADNIGFKTLYSTVVTLRQLGKMDASRIPAVMISCIIRANVYENARLEAQKSKSTIQ